MHLMQPSNTTISMVPSDNYWFKGAVQNAKTMRQKDKKIYYLKVAQYYNGSSYWKVHAQI